MPTVTTVLHAKTLGSLPAVAGERTEYRDELVAGLALRVTPAGARSWSVVYSRGRRHSAARMTLGTLDELSVAEARRRAKQILVAAAAGADPAGEARASKRRTPGLTVAGLARDYLADLARLRKRQKGLRPRTEAEYRRLIEKEILPRIGDRPPAAVSRSEVRELIRRIEGRAPIVANRTFEMIRRLYSWAVAEDRVLGSPCVGLKRPTPEEPTDRVLSREELRALQLALDELPSNSSDAVRLLLLTGTRLRMVLGMRRDELLDVDEKIAAGRSPALARWAVAGGYGGRSKNRRGHVTPLSGPALAIVRRRIDATGGRGDLLFPNQNSPRRHAVWQSSYVRRLCRRLERALNEGRARRGEPPVKVPRWTVHQLRHTLRTHIREHLGVRDDVAELIVGHVRRGIAGTYNRAELLDERRAALVAWAAWLDRVKAERPAKVLAHRRRGAR